MGGGTDDYPFLLHTNQLIFLCFLKYLVHLEGELFLKNITSKLYSGMKFLELVNKLFKFIFSVLRNHKYLHHCQGFLIRDKISSFKVAMKIMA